MDRAVHPQDLAYGAQVRLGDAAPVDQQQLVPGPDAHVRARALRHDVVHHDAAQPRPPRHESQPAHVVVAQRAAGDARLDDDATPGIIDDQARPLEHGVADDTVDVRASEEALALASQPGGRGRDPQVAELELLQPHDRAVQLAHQARADRRLDRRRHAGESVLLHEGCGEDEAQARGAGVEQQPGRNGTPPTRLDLGTQQRQVRIRRERDGRARARVAKRRGIEQAHPACRVVDLHGEAVEHVVPHESLLQPPARLAQAAEGIQRRLVAVELEVAQPQRPNDGSSARVGFGRRADALGPVAIEPGMGQARVEHQPRGVAVDDRGDVDRPSIGIERHHRHGGRGHH